MAEHSIKDILRKIPSLKGPLPETDMALLPSNPHAAFQQWLEEALEAGVPEAHAMTLSTVDDDGCPDARVLILKNVDDRGWHFASKSNGPKGGQIKANSDVALTFYWSALGRQIRLRGKATRLSDDECATDFLARPIGSRIAAISSLQSSVLTDDEDLDLRMVEVAELLNRNPAHVERGWSLYAVAPSVVEFWQGATDRNHKRLLYTLTDDQSWLTTRLWP